MSVDQMMSLLICWESVLILSHLTGKKHSPVFSQKDRTAPVPVKVVILQLKIKTSESTLNTIEHFLDFGKQIIGLRY